MTPDSISFPALDAEFAHQFDEDIFPGARVLRFSREQFGVDPADRALLFHGTSRARFENIRQEGLRPRMERGWKTRKAISLDASPLQALLYASEASGRDGSEPVVMAVHVHREADLGMISDDFWDVLGEQIQDEEEDGPDLTALQGAVTDYERAKRLIMRACETGPTRRLEDDLAALFKDNPASFALKVHGECRLYQALEPERIRGAWLGDTTPQLIHCAGGETFPAQVDLERINAFIRGAWPRQTGGLRR